MINDFIHFANLKASKGTQNPCKISPYFFLVKNEYVGWIIRDHMRGNKDFANLL